MTVFRTSVESPWNDVMTTPPPCAWGRGGRWGGAAGRQRGGGDGGDLAGSRGWVIAGEVQGTAAPPTKKKSTSGENSGLVSDEFASSFKITAGRTPPPP